MNGLERIEGLRKIVAGLSDLRARIAAGDIPTKDGICTGAYLIFNRVFKDTRAEVFQEWPHYSGDVDYPVRDPNKAGADAAAALFGEAFKRGSLWEGEYGDLRLDLLEHMLCAYKRMLRHDLYIALNARDYYDALVDLRERMRDDLRGIRQDVGICNNIKPHPDFKLHQYIKRRMGAEYPYWSGEPSYPIASPFKVEGTHSADLAEFAYNNFAKWGKGAYAERRRIYLDKLIDITADFIRENYEVSPC